MGESVHWPQHRIPVVSEWKQNQCCVTVWDSRFSWLFVYVRGMISAVEDGSHMSVSRECTLLFPEHAILNCPRIRAHY